MRKFIITVLAAACIAAAGCGGQSGSDKAQAFCHKAQLDALAYVKNFDASLPGPVDRATDAGMIKSLINVSATAHGYRCG